MKYVALLSGGKDSCYNILHCALNGHDLIASASLGPADGKEEIDSYLYQTVGQDAISLVAQALEVPLYRQVIHGKAIEQGMEYGRRDQKRNDGTAGDETEDLYALLHRVKTLHPEIESVSVGAILSNYQRIRVEHVCRRLELKCLCYLWQRDQSELFLEMIDAGMVAIIIKVAGIGLEPHHLGQTLAQMKDTLLNLHEQYGAHVCGEGGEYETLTLDCPMFRRRIALYQSETVVHADHGFAKVAYLRVKDAQLEVKNYGLQAQKQIAIQPRILDTKFEAVRSSIEESQRMHLFSLTPTAKLSWSEHPPHKLTHKSTSSWLTINDISVSNAATFEDEVEGCFKVLEEVLSSKSFKLADCVNINVFLSSMDYFSSLNVLYAKRFGSSPPSRACVAVDLFGSNRIKLDCIACHESEEKRRLTLHVQSISYWAPANIGPYSQAVLTEELVHLSGQIGLIPGTMSLPIEPSFPIQTALAMQHTERVVNAMITGTNQWEPITLQNIYWLKSSKHLIHLKEAIPEKSKAAPTLFLGVISLPKGACIEMQSLFHTGRYYIHEDEDDDFLTLKQDHPIWASGSIGGTISWSRCALMMAKASTILICYSGIAPVSDDFREKLKEVVLEVSQANMLSVTLYYTPAFEKRTFVHIHEMLFECDSVPMASVPCSFISNMKGDWVDWAIRITSI